MTGWLLFAVLSLALVPSVFSASRKTLGRQGNRDASGKHQPGISVIVVARDEERGIRKTLESLLETDYPDLELIAVNDRSRDATGRIMDELAAESPRLRTLHLSELPEDWLGKNHAMHRGAEIATRDILLFTDGDIVFHPRTLQLSVQYLQDHELDHLCLFPSLIPGGIFENALCILFGLLLVVGCPPWLIPSRIRFVYVGIGAFNMLCRTAYDQVGGHQPIRFDVLDDVKLGKLIKNHGLKQDILMADSLLEVRWQQSFAGVIRGLEKNAFAAVEYSIAKCILVTTLLSALLIFPTVITLAYDAGYGWGYPLAAAMAHGIYGWFSWRNGCSVLAGVLLVPAVLSLLFAIWRSTVLALARGGIIWRSTFYPLERLRKELYR